MTTLFKRVINPAQNPADQRSEERILVNISVELTRFDENGKASIERTTIEDVTSVGCRFTTRAKFQRGEIVSIRPLTQANKCLDKGKPELFEVMWTAPLGSHWTVGARKLEGEKLANTKFPP